MPKFWVSEQCRFTWLLNSRMVVVNVGVLLAALLLLFLLLPAVRVKPPQPVEVVSITPITTDTVPAASETSVVTSEQPSLPAQNDVAAVAVAVEDKPWLTETPQPPLTAGQVIFAYGWQLHPVFKDWRYHNGWDIAATSGQSVTAVLSGIVVTSGEAKQTGLTVAISSGHRQISYGCLSRTLLRAGQKIAQGEVIGATGQSLAEPYPHLHIDYKLDDEYQDPQKLFK